MNLRTELGSPNDNPIRYRTFLEKAREKAQAYTREFVARKVWLDVDFSVFRIEEDQINLNGGFGLYRIDSQDHRGRNDLLLLKVGQDISKERALELRRGQNLLVRVDVVDVAVEESNRSPYVKFTVKNVRLPEKNERAGHKNEREKEAEHKEKPEDDGLPRFDPNDLQRTVFWGWAIVERLQQDADNAIRHRATLEKLRKDISVHEDAKVRWSFVVASIKEDRVELYADPRYRNSLISRTGSSVFVTDNSRFGFLALQVDRGISKEKAAKLKPGDTITVTAKVSRLTLEGVSIMLVLGDLRVAEARKQNR